MKRPFAYAIAYALTILLLVTVLSGCKTDDVYSSEFFAMDTIMNITVYGQNAKEAGLVCEHEIYRLDELLSTGNPESEVSGLNAEGRRALSQDTSLILSKALDISAMTGGAYDATVYPLVSAWGFYTREYRIPQKTELDRLLEKTGSEMVSFDGKTVSFGKEGMAVDFGGIAKGYASDRLNQLLREHGIESAIISLGGNVYGLGEKTDGGAWAVAVQDPDDPAGYAGILSVTDMAVVTSGGYQRFFEMNGRIYHHIIDPSTGYPADSGLTSVTIVSNDGMLADGLSTALFVMGKDEALSFWSAHREEFDAVLISNDGGICITKGIEDSFQSDRIYEVYE
jgi:thiamine biosynthesis lipoprotein